MSEMPDIMNDVPTISKHGAILVLETITFLWLLPPKLTDMVEI